ncbi:MAG: DUF2807 domain-containing protein [Prevotella bivia]|nr:DUF2807 domain-containing protein [Prevotella bivia]
MRRNCCIWNIIAIICLFAMACASTSCIRLKDKDAGPMVAKNVLTKSFDKLFLSGVGEFYVTQSDTTSVKIVAPAKYQDKLKAVWKASELKIFYDGNGDGKPDEHLDNMKDVDVSIFITTPKLTSVIQEGVGSLKIDKKFETDYFYISVKGVAKANLNNFRAKRFDADVEGVAKLNVDTLTADTTHLAINGICKVDVNFEKSGITTVSADGICYVNLTGTLKQKPIKSKDGITRISDDTELWK